MMLRARFAQRPELRSVALVLALLLPLESSHCLWMGAPPATPRSGERHACCPDPPPTNEAPASGSSSIPSCPCLEQAPAATTPNVVLSALERASAITPAVALAAAPALVSFERPLALFESAPHPTTRGPA